jgi:hypothetical protein
VWRAKKLDLLAVQDNGAYRWLLCVQHKAVHRLDEVYFFCVLWIQLITEGKSFSTFMLVICIERIEDVVNSLYYYNQYNNLKVLDGYVGGKKFCIDGYER